MDSMRRNNAARLNNMGEVIEEQQRDGTDGEEECGEDALLAGIAALAESEEEGKLDGRKRVPLRVAVRVRPLNSKEIASGLDDILTCETTVGYNIQVMDFVPMQYNVVFGPRSTQQDVFNHCCKPLVDAALSGQTACMFAYGQTGSGKTFSMLGADGGRCPTKLSGVIPQLASELFRRTMGRSTEAVWEMRATFVEIYNHKIYDLLAAVSGPQPDNPERRPELELREDENGDFEVVGAEATRVYSSAGLAKLIETASLMRTTTANAVHDNSSRSHAFLSLMLDRRQKSASGETFVSQPSQLHLIDLAGSEQFEDARLDVGINFSLVSLGKVLMALAADAAHVPFRDSTLTMLLKKVLSGNCVNVMLACLNPLRSMAHETINTLRYAMRASDVVNLTKASEYDTVADNGAVNLTQEDFDPDEELNARTERITTPTFGDIFARAIGDAMDPLVLYLHDTTDKSSNAASFVWNPLAMDLAKMMNETHRKKQEKEADEKRKKEEAEKRKREEAQEKNRRQSKGMTDRVTKRKPTVIPDDPNDALLQAQLNRSPELLDAETKFESLRTDVSSSLYTRQLELVENSCAACGGIPFTPRRMRPCRHTVCGVCYEAGQRYYSSCVKCARELEPCFMDDDLSGVVQSRINAAKDSMGLLSRLASNFKGKMSVAERERELATRLVFEYGSLCEAAGSGEPMTTTVFLRIRDQGVYTGSESKVKAQTGYELIDRVIINPTPDKPPPADATMPQPTHTELKFALTRPSTSHTFDIDVHWLPRLGLAPFRLRYVSPLTPRHAFDFVVQLPQRFPSGSLAMAAAANVEERKVIEVPNADLTSGWLIYTAGAPPKTYGTFRLFGRATNREELEEGTRMLGKAGTSLTGDIAMVQKLLFLAAAKQVSLPQLSEHAKREAVVEKEIIAAEKAEAEKAEAEKAEAEKAEAAAAAEQAAAAAEQAAEKGAQGGEEAEGLETGAVAAPAAAAPVVKVRKKAWSDAAGSSPLLRSCGNSEPTESIALVYSTLFELLGAWPELRARAEALEAADLAGDNNKENAVPTRFFHVAIDWPGFGQTSGDKSVCSKNAALLVAELSHSLAKLNVLAIVVRGQATSAAMQIMIQRPQLVNFVVLIEPSAQSAEALDSAARIMHPVMLLAGPEPTSIANASAFAAALPKGTSKELQPANGGSVPARERQLGLAILEFFTANEWTGYVGFGGDCIDHTTPLLSVLAGGLSNWRQR